MALVQYISGELFAVHINTIYWGRFNYSKRPCFGGDIVALYPKYASRLRLQSTP